MKKYIILSSFLLSIFGFVGFAHAQTDTATTVIEVPVTTSSTIDASIATPVAGSTATVTASSLANVGILPTSAFYFFKEWSRGFQRFFTKDPIAKANLELKIADEKALELKKVQEIAPNNAEAVKKAFDNYQNSQERLNQKIEDLKQVSDNPDVEKILARISEKKIENEKIAGDISARAQEKINSAEKAVNELETMINNVSAQVEQVLPITATTEDNSTTTLNVTVEGEKSDFTQNNQKRIDTAKKALEDAKNKLSNAKESLTALKYGEAFGQAQAAESIARKTIGFIANGPKQNEGQDAKEGDINKSEKLKKEGDRIEGLNVKDPLEPKLKNEKENRNGENKLPSVLGNNCEQLKTYQPILDQMLSTGKISQEGYDKKIQGLNMAIENCGKIINAIPSNEGLKALNRINGQRLNDLREQNGFRKQDGGDKNKIENEESDN